MTKRNQEQEPTTMVPMTKTQRELVFDLLQYYLELNDQTAQMGEEAPDYWDHRGDVLGLLLAFAPNH